MKQIDFRDTLFISDLDGTLLTPKAVLSPYAAETLNRLMSEGLRFTAATARTPATALQLLRELALTEPVMLMNGVLVYDPQTSRYLNIEIMSRGCVNELLSRMRKHGINGFLYLMRDEAMETHYERIEGESMEEFHRKRVKHYKKPFTHTPDFSSLLDEQIIYLTLKDTPERLRPVFEDMCGIPGVTAEFYTDTYDARWWYLECHSDRATKYNGARFIQSHTSVGNLIGFGDNINDIPLFRACNMSYAVANAREELKAIATGVIGPNSDDGVVRFLESLWINQPS